MDGLQLLVACTQGEELDSAYESISAFGARKSSEEDVLGAEETITEIKCVVSHAPSLSPTTDMQLRIECSFAFAKLLRTCMLTACLLLETLPPCSTELACRCDTFRESTVVCKGEAAMVQKHIRQAQANLDALSAQTTTLMQGRRLRSQVASSRNRQLQIAEEQLASCNLEVGELRFHLQLSSKLVLVCLLQHFVSCVLKVFEVHPATPNAYHLCNHLCCCLCCR